MLFLWTAAFLLGAEQARAAPTPTHFEHDGIAVDFSLATASGEPRAGAPAVVRFAITDTTTKQPLRGLRPAAWLSRRVAAAVGQPRSCEEKVQEFLGGSVFSRADLDLNSFQVLALNEDATVTVVDPRFSFGGSRLLALVTLPGPGADWALCANGSRLLVSVPSTRQVAIIDTATWRTVALLATAAVPGRVVVQPDGHYAWSVDTTGATVVDIDHDVVAAHLATGRDARDIVFSADSHWAFVTHAGDDFLSVIDVRTLKKIRDVPLAFRPASAAYSSQSQAVYLTDPAGNIAVVDAVKHEVVARVAGEPGLDQIRFSPGDRFALVAVPGRNLILVIDAASNRIVQRANVSGAPEQFAFSGDLAFVRRRDSSAVGTIPLKEIGRDGAALPLAEFTGGEAAFGARTSLADAIVPVPGESAVVVANAKDHSIYYYMAGMAAPMGSLSNYNRQPRAVMVIDRSLHEAAPGVYESAASLPSAGDYDAVFFLDAPKVVHCFPAKILPDLAAPANPRDDVRIVAQSAPPLVAGTAAHLTFTLSASSDSPPRAVPDDLSMLVVLVPGTWRTRPSLTRGKAGFSLEFTPPLPGVYYFYPESPSLRITANQSFCLVLRAAPSPTADAK